MRFFRTTLQKTKIRVKLPLAIAVPTLLVFAFAGTFISLQTNSVLERNLRNSYETLLAERSAVLEEWLESATMDVSAFAQNGSVIQGLRDFGGGWRPIGDEDPSTMLRRLYITENPNPAGEKDMLDTAGDKSPWTFRHKTYHPGFRAYQRARGYYDMFLFDPQGNLIYSVFKEDDFATNFLDGPYADSGLGIAYRAALDLQPWRNLHQ